MGLRVLICDDDPVAREVLRRALDAEGIELVGVAERAQDALGLLATAEPDVVLMDVVMEGMDGVEAAARIAAERPATDTVLLTATPDVTTSTDGLAAGAAAYLPKSLVGIGRLPATLLALRGDEDALGRRIARRLVAGLRRDLRDVLTEREWLRLELAAGGEAGHRAADLLARLRMTGDERVAALTERLSTD